MQFNTKIWLNIYNKVHKLGKELKDSKIDYFGNPPIAPLEKDEQRFLENEIKTLLQKSDVYLNQCGLRRSKPLWKFNFKDKTTWPSDPSFKYGHLLEG